VGLRDRLPVRLGGLRTPPPVAHDPADPSLVVVVEAFEAARADSAVLAEAAERGVDLAPALLVRHHLVDLPTADAVAEAARLLAQDGYVVLDAPGDARTVHACRTQVLTALSASQERSRMAGLAQRLGGDVAGWDALAPCASPAD
jgi:hypothetical protein